MFRNYIKTAVRSLLRHRFFSVINIFGLSIAMALSMVIIMLVADQLTYDRHITKRERIYRINTNPIGQQGQQFSEVAYHCYQHIHARCFRNSHGWIAGMACAVCKTRG